MKIMPKILIVDDEINVLKAIKRLLSQYKLEIRLETSSVNALEIVKNSEFDLIITDQRMPEMDGTQLLMQVKEISPNTVRILMSGYSDIEVFISAINNGNIYQYISKPWDNKKFVKTILNALGAKAERDEQQTILKFITEKNKRKELIYQTKFIQFRNLVNNIMQNKENIPPETMEEAKLLDIDLSAPLYCFILSAKNSARSFPERLKDLKKEIIFFLCLIPNCLAVDWEENIGVIRQARVSDNKEELYKNISNIIEIIKSYFPDLEVKAGVSNVNLGTDSVHIGFQQAESALAASRLKTRENSILHFYKDIGILQLLGAFKGNKIAVIFMEEHLGKLIRYDNEKGGNLVLTLEEILKCQNLKKAAENLFIHPKTLVFRRNRIKEILGTALEDYETRLSLEVAIKIYRLTK